MLFLTLIAPLWHPVRDQLCLIRALAAGGRIPGTNLILMPAGPGKASFGITEHLMMALAGGWLIFRVIYCKLADEDKQSKLSHHRNSVKCGTKAEIQTETVLEEINDDNVGQRRIENSEQNKQNDHGKDERAEGEGEELYYWKGERFGKPPLLKFTRQQLEILLRLQPDHSDNNVDNDESDFLDIINEDYSNGYATTTTAATTSTTNTSPSNEEEEMN